MKLMIDIPDSTYEAIMARDWKNAGWLFSEELKAIHDGTPIPDNATNGDMIKALFPNFQINEEWKATRHFELSTDCTEITGIATSDWWNSPYKRGETE